MMKRYLPGKFYVYEHWRPDLDVCFYVGKGKGKRAYGFQRNKYYGHVVAKLAKLGMCVEVRLVRGGLTEKEAFAMEITRIAFWRNLQVRLTNQTDGGEGASGVVRTEEAKRKNAVAHKGRKNSEKTIQLMRASAQARWEADRVNGNIERDNLTRKRTGNVVISTKQRKAIRKALTGRKLPLEQRRKIQATLTGRKLSQGHCLKISRALIGREPSPEVLQKLRAQASARKGVPHLESTKAKMRASHAARIQRLKEEANASCL